MPPSEPALLHLVQKMIERLEQISPDDNICSNHLLFLRHIAEKLELPSPVSLSDDEKAKLAEAARYDDLIQHHWTLHLLSLPHVLNSFISVLGMTAVVVGIVGIFMSPSTLASIVAWLTVGGGAIAIYKGIHGLFPSLTSDTLSILPHTGIAPHV